MRIQVITRENGYGLSKDIQVLREALPAHDVDFTDYNRPRKAGHWDWNIHLELVNTAHFGSGTYNAFVPNPEWTAPSLAPAIKRFDILLAKTRHTERIMKHMHHNVQYVGWTSPEPIAMVDSERLSMVHIAGDSIGKGTGAVIEAAALCPDIPITILQRNSKANVPDNVTMITGTLTSEQVAEYRRAPVHLCPSAAEGFGHYINEARAMGAVVITTDAGPMDELILDTFGFRIPVCSEHPMRMDLEKRVCTDVLADCMYTAWNNKALWPAWSERGQAAYKEGREQFHKAINELIQ
jgi:hypothetical protein